MQKRHQDRIAYFHELAHSSREFFLPYIQSFIHLSNKEVLEIGCGEGGNLLPFYENGCNVTGIDLSEVKIDTAKTMFQKSLKDHVQFEFRVEDFFQTKTVKKYDLIFVHDVIEHILDKDRFMMKVEKMLADNGLVFFGFPAWQMPFGGHQQICKSKILSVLPFIHLLPKLCYKGLLNSFGESKSTIAGLLEIRDCKMTVESFEKLIKSNGFDRIDRTLWFINPHYKTKFGIPPVKVTKIFSKISFLRNYYTTSCFFIIRKKHPIKIRT